MTEPRIPLLTEAEAKETGDAHGVSEALSGLNIFRVLLRQPRLARSMQDLLVSLLAGESLDMRLRELIIMRIGWRTGSVYEWTQHWRVALQLGVAENDLLAVRDWENHDHWSETDRAVLRATDETLDRGAISAATWGECARLLPEPAEQLELVGAIGTWTMISQILRSLEVVSVTTSENGEQVLGADVTYSFAVTNTGMSTLTDISVIDDHLGPIPGSPIGSLAAGETATLTQTAFVNETTTNTVTATGTSAGSETCSDRDEITVERVDPPVDPATCDQNVAVAAVTFRYTGQGCLCSTNDQGGRSYCSGNAAFQQPVRIRVENDNGAGVYADVDGVLLEQTVRAAASNANQQTLRAQIRALIYNDGGSLLEELSIHTSCSEPLDIGDQFGSLRVVNLEVR